MKKLVLFVLIIFVFSNVARAATLVPLTKHIGQGSTGSSVTTLQNFLVSSGYLTGSVDGKFGPKTKAGVIKYQKANKISPTGFVGPLTLASINKAIIYLNSNTSNNSGTNNTKTLGISTTSILPEAQIGTEYQTEIAGVGGTAGYNWEIVSGALPPGVLLTVTAIRCIKAPCYNWMPAHISGTPTQAGNYSFTMQVVSGDEIVQKNFSLKVSSQGSNGGVVCEYAQPPAGYHYENMHTNPPCGADLVVN